MRVSHGCVRLYPENIEYLYELVSIGVAVNIINEPYLVGRLNDEWYFEGHTPLEDDLVNPQERLDSLLQTQFGSERAIERLLSAAEVADGVPVRLGVSHVDEVLARARIVRNTVEVDPDAPTLSEVREMIDEAVKEAEDESESL
jgi:L,D-transpeptidase ErfK/SrfK